MSLSQEDLADIYASLKKVEAMLVEQQKDIAKEREMRNAFDKMFEARMRLHKENIKSTKNQLVDVAPLAGENPEEVTKEMETQSGPQAWEQFNWIDRTLNIPCEDEEKERMEEEEEENQEIPPTPIEGKQNLYFNNIIANEATSVMKVEAYTAGAPVTVLIDCGATHNFISPELVRNKNIPTEKEVEFDVTLGTGIIYQGNGKCPAMDLHIKDLTICAEFHEMPLVSSDLVLGMSWLRTLGDTRINWKNQTMEFIVGGQMIHLQGNPLLQPTRGHHHHCRPWPAIKYPARNYEEPNNGRPPDDLGDKIAFKGGGPDVSPTHQHKYFQKFSSYKRNFSYGPKKAKVQRTPRKQVLCPRRLAQVLPGLIRTPGPYEVPFEIIARDLGLRSSPVAHSEGSSNTHPAMRPRISPSTSEDPSEELSSARASPP